jgi:hypothetical protein
MCSFEKFCLFFFQRMLDFMGDDAEDVIVDASRLHKNRASNVSFSMRKLANHQYERLTCLTVVAVCLFFPSNCTNFPSMYILHMSFAFKGYYASMCP